MHNSAASSDYSPIRGAVVRRSAFTALIVFLLTTLPTLALAGGGGGGGGVQAVTVAAPLHWLWAQDWSLILRAISVVTIAILLCVRAPRQLRARSQRFVFSSLLLMAMPWEVWISRTADLWIQTQTAQAARLLLSGLGVESQFQLTKGLPTLVTQDRWIHVTGLCASTQMVLALLTLGLVIAAVFAENWRRRLVIALLTPVAGIMANIIRVALSAHAVSTWARTDSTWATAHAAVGYGSFVACYAALWLLLRKSGPTPIPG